MAHEAAAVLRGVMTLVKFIGVLAFFLVFYIIVRTDIEAELAWTEMTRGKIVEVHGGTP